MKVFEQLESEVRGYCRAFPTVFEKAQGYRLQDEGGRQYVDFFAGAGALNYGHNDPGMKARLIDYLTADGVTHSLDMATSAKATFLERFNEVILKPRGMRYKVQFPGPTGTNSVEAALKLARKITGREIVIGFTNAFHGMTLGSLAVTGNGFKRSGAGVPLNHGVSMPYEGFLGDDQDTLAYLEAYLADKGSGVELPAAIIVETVQGEGGLNTASTEWLQKLERLCREWEILLIVDDIQAGCGRTGTFFSFEPAGLSPDIICLSKSLSGYGLPMAITLIKPEHDVWAPGEHNGTFRGHNLAFVTATEALRFWESDDFAADVRRKSQLLTDFLAEAAAAFPALKLTPRGRGFLQGVACEEPEVAKRITGAAFERGLIMETSGPEDEVCKLMPPLTIDDAGLTEGLEALRGAMAQVAGELEGDRKGRQIA